MQHVTDLFAEYEPIAIYLGLPKHLSGSDGEAVTKVEAFASRIAEISTIPVHYVDERLSTVDAQRRLREAGKSAKDSKILIDSMAAVAILEGGLARENK